MNNDFLALLSILSVLCILVVTQVFGHIELVMLISRMKSFVLALFRTNGARHYSFHLQGSRDWNLMWQSVIECAEKLNLTDVRLDVNLAAVQEGFHASWRRPSRADKSERWNAEVPLFAGEHVVGRLTVGGTRPSGYSSCETINQLMEMLEPLEAEIVALVSLEQTPAAASNAPTMETPEPAGAKKLDSAAPLVLEEGCLAEMPGAGSV
jgi:hypothetical protein